MVSSAGRENACFTIGYDTQHRLVAWKDTDFTVRGTGDDALGLTNPDLMIGSNDVHFEYGHGLLLHLFVVAHDVVKPTHVEESLLRNVIDLACAELREPFDRVGQRNRRTGHLSELLGGVGVL